MDEMYQFGTKLSRTLCTIPAVHGKPYRHNTGYMIANYLKDARTRRGITQEELAEMIGVTHTTVQRHESGRRGINTEMLHKYAAALGCRVSEITEGLGAAPQNEIQEEALKLMQTMSEREQALYLHGLKASIAVKEPEENKKPSRTNRDKAAKKSS
jgi:putative transcriptional regulator